MHGNFGKLTDFPSPEIFPDVLIFNGNWLLLGMCGSVDRFGRGVVNQLLNPSEPKEPEIGHSDSNFVND